MQHVSKKILCLFFVSSALFADGGLDEDSKSQKKTVYDKIARQNMNSFGRERSDSWSAHGWYEYLVSGLKRQLQPPGHLKRDNLLSLFSLFEESKEHMGSKVLDDTKTWDDLQMFCGKEDLMSYFASKVDRTTTDFGKVYLYGALVQPSVDIEELEKRQGIVKEFLKSEELFGEIDRSFKKLKEAENVLISMWEFWGDGKEQFAMQAERKALKDVKLLNRLGKYEPTVMFMNHTGQASSAASFASSIVASVLLPVCGTAIMTGIDLKTWGKTYEEYRNYSGPYFGKLLKWISDKSREDDNTFFKTALGFCSILAGVYCGVHIEQQWDMIKGSLYCDICLQTKLIKLATALKALKSVCMAVDKNKVLRENLVFYKGMRKFFFGGTDKIKKFLKLISSSTFQGKPSLLSRHGRTIIAYNLASEIKDDIGELILAAGEIDCYMSTARLYKEHEYKDVTYSFAQYKAADTPSIELEDFWNPFIIPSKAIANNIKLGVGESCRNAIITGPNAGGKSTALKSIAVNLIMAQTLGIAPSREIKITPFSKIATYLNISDDISKGDSLFQAEVSRAQKIIEGIQELKPGEFSFLVMDEVFSGTSPVEGEAAAYSVAKHLGKFTKNVCLIATHFPLLSKLEETKNFDNYKVSIWRLRSGALKYPFKLERGVSDQHAAIDVLRSKGFNGEIIDTAEEIIEGVENFGSIIDEEIV